jgi:hypothetical protein
VFLNEKKEAQRVANRAILPNLCIERLIGRQCDDLQAELSSGMHCLQLRDPQLHLVHQHSRFRSFWDHLCILTYAKDGKDTAFDTQVIGSEAIAFESTVKDHFSLMSVSCKKTFVENFRSP